MELAEANGAKIIVFPELCLTGYTCRDLFWQELLLRGKEGLHQILFLSKGKDALVFVGLPWEKDGKLYNVAAAIQQRTAPGMVPKSFLPNYSEFYEARHFTPGKWKKCRRWQSLKASRCSFGSKLLFSCPEVNGPYRGSGDLRRSLDAGAAQYRPCPGRSDCDCQPLRQRRGDREKTFTAPAGQRPVCPPGLRLCLRQCGRRRVQSRIWSLAATTSLRKTE